jgi:hypothetical protein
MEKSDTIFKKGDFIMGDLLYTLEPEYFGIEKGSKEDTEKFRNKLLESFTRFRGNVCDIINKKIDDVNKEWDKTGKKTYFGPEGTYDLEYVNPEYYKHLCKYFERDIKIFNMVLKFFRVPCLYYLDNQFDICGYYRKNPKIKIKVWLKEI